jgi:hypothetical protein
MRTRTSSAAFAVIATVLVLAAAPRPARAADTPAAGAIEASITSVGAGGATIGVSLSAPLAARDLVVADQAAKARLAKAQAGDIVLLDVDSTADPHSITKLEKLSRPVAPGARLVALALAFILLLLLAALMARRRPQDFLIGTDNRYSNSQCQLALWFGAVATVYLAAVWLRIIYLGWDFVGGVGLTTNLVALTGLSAFTFGSAKVITAQKVDTAAQAGHADAKPAAASPNLLTDLVQNDFGRADLGDFQMILIALAAVAIFVLSAFNFLGALELATPVTLPDVDTTLLSAFGLGQGAYLIKKGAAKLGEG